MKWKKLFKAIGIIPYISQDDRQHHYPHLHLFYGEYTVIINLRTLTIIEKDKKFPVRKIKKILSLFEKHTELQDFLIKEFYRKNPHLK